MKYSKILLILFFFSSSIIDSYGQKTIKGRVIDDFFDIIPSVRIYDQDTILLGETDFDGYFEIKIPEESKTLLFYWIMYEFATISISDDCQFVELILIAASSYDFMSNRKVDRLRKKEFKKLPELHIIAVDKGLFINDSICYKREFIPNKPELDKIR